MSQIKITRPSEEELERLNVKTWSPWECDVSTFNWQYEDEEVCYIQEGRVIIKTEDGEEVEIKKGDLVTFPKGMKCVWEVKEKVRKVYTFN